ncbi:MAG: ribonuclease III domain-containing protein [Bacillota bacterium]|nr:ribonuclease III domain-containing protein [Bacillota bacterium]
MKQRSGEQDSQSLLAPRFRPVGSGSADLSAGVSELSPRDLAYVGDAVFELAVRQHLVGRCSSPGERHRDAVRRVRAGAQAAFLRGIEPYLAPAEEDLVRRARNFKGAAVPRGSTPAEYRASTAFEALLGYLYLRGESGRLQGILAMVLERTDAP